MLTPALFILFFATAKINNTLFLRRLNRKDDGIYNCGGKKKKMNQIYLKKALSASSGSRREKIRRNCFRVFVFYILLSFVVYCTQFDNNNSDFKLIPLPSPHPSPRTLLDPHSLSVSYDPSCVFLM